MKMTHSLTQRMIMRCALCGEEMTDHKPNCPRKLAEQILRVMDRSSFRCPECIDGTTLVNRDDFIECRKCHTVFTTGPCHPKDAKTVFLGDTIAKKLPEKGSGNFPLLKRLEELRKLEKSYPKKGGKMK